MNSKQSLLTQFGPFKDLHCQDTFCSTTGLTLGGCFQFCLSECPTYFHANLMVPCSESQTLSTSVKDFSVATTYSVHLA